MKDRTFSKFSYIIFMLIAMQFGSRLSAFPREQIIQSLKGPWELMVNFGAQDSGIVFPIEVTDDNSPQELDRLLPVMGTPLQIKVLRYCPDLKWIEKVTEDPNGSEVLTVIVSNGNVEKEVFLIYGIPEKRSVTSNIGGLAIRAIKNQSMAETLIQQMQTKKIAGMLAFYTDPNKPPREFVVEKGEEFLLPNTSYKVNVLDYMPHYSIDRETKSVTNFSDEPVNPALKIRLSDGENIYEQWLWSNFAASPHAMSKFPIQIEFSDFDAGPSEDRYFIITAGDSDFWLYSMDKHKIKIEKAELKKPYQFNDQEFTFTLDSFTPKGSMKTAWENRSNELKHPALIVEIESDKKTQQSVVELNKPAHIKTEFGTLVLYYSQKSKEKEHGTL